MPDEVREQVRSRLILDIPGDLLAQFLELPEGLRVLGAFYKDDRGQNVVSILVEGDSQFKYRWIPGMEVAHQTVYSRGSLKNGLFFEKGE